MTLALLVARSGPVDFGNEALHHVNDPPMHLVACVHALGRDPEVRFIQSPHPDPVLGYGTHYKKIHFRDDTCLSQ